jgi:hypothetical protein
MQKRYCKLFASIKNRKKQPFRKTSLRIIQLLTNLTLCIGLLPESVQPLFSEIHLSPQPVTHQQSNQTIIYQWGLFRWQNNQLKCAFRTYSDREPNEEEILIACGEEISTEFKNTKLCYPYIGTNTKDCRGLYLYQLGAYPVNIDLSPETTIIPLQPELTNCAMGEACAEHPLLNVSALFPVPKGSDIVQLEKIYIDNGQLEQSCRPPECVYKLPKTDEAGDVIEYWGEYSNETLTNPKEVIFRNIYNEIDETFQLDIIDDSWKDNFTACEYEWEVFPVSNSFRGILYEMPESVLELHTEVKYTLLAGRLIWMGVVDVSGCADGGLTENLAASPCGMQKALSHVNAMQNNFNQQIMEASQHNHIPPRVLKGLIGQESQFWREPENPDEYGFGHITEMGMDQLLMWNYDYFMELCLLHLEEGQCQMGYTQLGEFHQDYLIGQSIRRVGTSLEFDLLAKSLKAGCNQTYQIVRNLTMNEPREILAYSDLWRINLGIYTAGAGCIGDAIEVAWKIHPKEFTWKNIAKYLDEGCKNADGYFDRVEMYGVNTGRSDSDNSMIAFTSDQEKLLFEN